MPARKPRLPAETASLVLAARQREAMLAEAKLPGALGDRFAALTKPREGVPLTADELIKLGDAVHDVLERGKASAPRVLDAILDRIGGALATLEDRERGRRRAALPVSDKVYQIKVTLRHIRPAIWRRFLIADGTLGDLHGAIQDVMGWEESHMHQFVMGKGRERELYGLPEDLDDPFGGFLDMPHIRDEDEVLISRFAPTGRKQAKFTYEYDFGDGWEHDVVIEKVLDPEPGVAYPVCLDGARACPPEDCGSPWGYADFVDAMADPSHESHDELTEWYGGPFDPEGFSADASNRTLRADRRGR